MQYRGGFGSTDLALKSARIVDFCCKLSGFTDLENAVDRGSAVNFDADSGLCLSRCLILGHKRNWTIDFSSALVGMLMSSSKLFLFSKKLI